RGSGGREPPGRPPARPPRRRPSAWRSRSCLQRLSLLVSWKCGVPRPKPIAHNYITAAVEEIYTVPESAEAPRSLLVEAGDRDRAGRFEPDAAAGDVSHLAGDGERAELLAEHVDPADLSELQRGRRGHRDPEPVTACVFGASKESLVVDPH